MGCCCSPYTGKIIIDENSIPNSPINYYEKKKIDENSDYIMSQQELSSVQNPDRTNSLLVEKSNDYSQNRSLETR